jgi:hypothetical protein
MENWHRRLIPDTGPWNFSDNVNVTLILTLALGFTATIFLQYHFVAKMRHIEERLLEMEGRRKDSKKKRHGNVPRQRQAEIQEMLQPSSPMIYKPAAMEAMAGSADQPKFSPGGLEAISPKDYHIFGSPDKIAALKEHTEAHAERLTPVGTGWQMVGK